MSTLASDPSRTRSQQRLAVVPLRDVVVRDATGTGDGSWTIEGYAAVYEQETVLYDIAGWWRVREEIARDAFQNVLERLAHGDGLVHLNHGHDMKTAMAASDVTGIGGLELGSDFHGLRFFARVDPEDPDARALAVKMRNKVVRQSSFAFTIESDELVESEQLEDGTLDQLWRVTEIGDLFDVCVCAQGAYPQTESHLRSLAAASFRVPDVGAPGRSPVEGRPHRSAPEGESPIAPVAGQADPKRDLARLKAEIAVSHDHRTRKANQL